MNLFEFEPANLEASSHDSKPFCEPHGEAVQLRFFQAMLVIQNFFVIALLG